MNTSDIMDVKPAQKSTKTTNSGTTTTPKKSSITIQTVFSHLDQFRQKCLTKETKKAEKLLSTFWFREIFTLTNRYNDLKSMFSELFAVMEIFGESSNKDSLISARTTRKTNRSKAAMNDFEVCFFFINMGIIKGVDFGTKKVCLSKKKLS